MYSQSEMERELYEARLKLRRDEYARLSDAREDGILQGRERGELLGRVKLCEEFLQQTPTPAEALDALTMEQLRELADKLEAQLLGGK